MFGLRTNKKLLLVVDRLCKGLNRVEVERDDYKALADNFRERLHKMQTPQPTITLANNNFPKAVLANLVATHGVDSNDCKNHQRDRDTVMSGILSAISYGYKEFHMEGTLSKYVAEELQEAGYEVEPDEEGVVIRWGSAYLTP